MAIVPSIAKTIQLEETHFTAPGSESMLQKIAGSQHYLLDAMDQYAIGEVFYSMLTEAQVQADLGTGFILCDGRSVVGSQYQTITGQANVPDARGIFLRNQQGSRNDGLGNESGNLSLGQFQGDQVVAHIHNVSTGFNIMTFDPGVIANSGGVPNSVFSNSLSSLSIDVVPSSGNETRPRCMTVNVFIRIN